jgi:hypothetical protein
MAGLAGPSAAKQKRTSPYWRRICARECNELRLSIRQGETNAPRHARRQIRRVALRRDCGVSWRVERR